MSLFPLVSVTLFHEHSPNCLRYLGGKISQHFNLTMRSSESDSRDRPIVKPHLTTKLADFMSHKTRSVLQAGFVFVDGAVEDHTRLSVVLLKCHTKKVLTPFGP